MPATVVSNTNFGLGQLVLTDHATSVAADGFVEVSMSFACKDVFLQQNLARFRMESAPPAPLPADVAALPLETGSIYLAKISSTSLNGLGYINANYVGCSLDQRKRVTESFGQRTFSGIQQVQRTIISGASAGTSIISLPIIFDYTAQSMTVAWSAIQDESEPVLEPTISDIRNVQGGASLVASPISYAQTADRGYDVRLITELTVTPVGPVKRYVKTVTATAESSNPFQT